MSIIQFKVIVFSQLKKTRMIVGLLWREKNTFFFQYDRNYLRTKTAIPVGPDLPLTPQIMTSTHFFKSLKDRIPSKNNPAYPDYCEQWNISPNEQDELVLITTIGHRGPSSFIFRRDYIDTFDGGDLRAFRKELKLTVRDFALLIDSLPNTIFRTESGEMVSKLLLSLCELLANSKEALHYQLDKRGMYLHDEKIKGIKQYLLSTD